MNFVSCCKVFRRAVLCAADDALCTGCSFFVLFSQDDFRLIICQVDDWNRDLSAWEAPPVFGKMSACIWIRTRTPNKPATRRLAISRLTN